MDVCPCDSCSLRSACRAECRAFQRFAIGQRWRDDQRGKTPRKSTTATERKRAKRAAQIDPAQFRADLKRRMLSIESARYVRVRRAMRSLSGFISSAARRESTPVACDTR
jgi:hypothetical protein